MKLKRYSATFDTQRFYYSLDAKRVERRCAWADIARDTGLCKSIFTRMSLGKAPSAHGLACLLDWSGLEARDFIQGGRQPRVEAEASTAVFFEFLSGGDISKPKALLMPSLPLVG